MSAGFSGHLPERMLGAWRPGSEGDWCLCHPSQELPLSWCIIEPLNQLLPHCHLPPNCPGWRMGAKGKKNKKQRETDREVKVTSLFFCYLHLRCYGLVLRNTTTMDGKVEGLVPALGHLCQALTVHCVKLVIISSLKPCPVSVRPSYRCRLLGARRQTGPWSRMCLSGR